MASDLMKAMDIPKDLLIVAIPTHEMRAVVQSLLELGVFSQLLRRPIHFVVGEGSNIPRARNSIVQRLQCTFPDRDAVWVLWLDSDIEIPPGVAPAISIAVTWAEAHDACVVANYRMNTGHNVLMANRDPAEPAHHITDEEFQTMPNFAEVGMAGLSFAYLHQPLAYRFHADETGEDIHFWWDHPEIRLHWAKDIHLGHRKTVVLF